MKDFSVVIVHTEHVQYTHSIKLLSSIAKYKIFAFELVKYPIIYPNRL